MFYKIKNFLFGPSQESEVAFLREQNKSFLEIIQKLTAKPEPKSLSPEALRPQIFDKKSELFRPKTDAEINKEIEERREILGI